MNKRRIREDWHQRLNSRRFLKSGKENAASHCEDRMERSFQKDEAGLRCLCCMEQMEEKADIAWILGLRRTLCEECFQKIFIRLDHPDRLSGRYRSCTVSMSRPAAAEKKDTVSVRTDTSENRDRFFVHRIHQRTEKNRIGRYFRFREREIPILQIYERTEDLSALWRQFSVFHDYELRDVFLQDAQEWTDSLQEFSLFSICPFDQKWVRTGWNPVYEAFAAKNLSISILLNKNENEELELTEQARLCASRTARTGFCGHMRRAVLIAEPEITQEELCRRMQFLHQSLPDLRAHAVLLLFCEEN